MDQYGAIVRQKGSRRLRTVTRDQNKAKAIKYCKNQRACTCRSSVGAASKVFEISHRSVRRILTGTGPISNHVIKHERRKTERHKVDMVQFDGFLTIWNTTQFTKENWSTDNLKT